MMERLYHAYHLARNTNGDFVDLFTAEQWLVLYDAYKASGWDFTPDRWTPEQVEAALSLREPPRFGDDEQPLPPLESNTPNSSLVVKVRIPGLYKAELRSDPPRVDVWHGVDWIGQWFWLPEIGIGDRISGRSSCSPDVLAKIVHALRDSGR